MIITFKDIKLTRDEALKAFNDFDDRYPDPNDYDNWLEKKTYLYAIRYQDKIYPPKYILSEISGIPTSEFNGGEQTNRVFRQLGFDIGLK